LRLSADAVDAAKSTTSQTELRMRGGPYSQPP
jgi:hypothetical protein